MLKTPKPLVILVNPQIIQQSIVNRFDQQKHILLEEKGDGIFVVIKNKYNLMRLFSMLQKLLKDSQITNAKHQQSSSSQIRIVSYSSKPANILYDKLSKINQYIANKIFYFNLQPQQHSTIRPNRAFLTTNNQQSLNLITYGEGYSQIKSKQQLRLAVQCAFNLHQLLMNRFFIIQTEKSLKQQQKQLRKQGCDNLFTLNSMDAMAKCVYNVMMKQRQLILQNINNNNMMMEQQSLQNSYYLKQLKSKLKQQQFKEITNNIIINHFSTNQQNPLQSLLIIISPSKIINQFLSKPKKSYTPTPKSTIRSPQSKQICSLVFKNVTDHKLYVAKSSTPKDIGGLYYQEKIQNKCFISLVANLFNQSFDLDNQNKKTFYSLPLQKSYSMMKYSLLKPYETKKACVLIKPYLQNLTCLQKHASQFLSLLKLQSSSIKGFGQMIFWSLISGQSFRTKTLLQQLSVLGFVSKHQPKYLISSYQSLEQFIAQNKLNQINLLRVDYYEPFSSTSSQFENFFAMKQDLITIPLTRQCSIRLDQLSIELLEEIYEMAVLIVGDGDDGFNNKNDLMQSFQQQQQQQQNPISSSPKIGHQMLKGIGRHYKWEFDKTQIVDSLFNKSKRLQSYIKKLLTQKRNKTIPFTLYKHLSQNLITYLQHHNPLQLLLFLSQDYARFIKPPSAQQKYFCQFYTKMDEQKQNKYVTALIQKTHSFQIYGNTPPIYSLPNWVRSLGLKYRFIEYMSMLTHTKEDFILISKRLKILSTNQKNNALLIIDHCQLCQQILDEAKSVRTIFISRFKKGEHEMQVICQQQSQTSKQQAKYLQQSNDQLITLLFEVYQKYIMHNDQSQKPFLYNRYKFVLQTYMRIKCQQYNFSCYQRARQFCLQLHKSISQSKNRYKQIQQKYKLNSQWRLLYMLPVEKRSQKVMFVKNLQSFIQVMTFVQIVRKQKQRRQNRMVQTNNNINMNSPCRVLKINAKLLASLKQWQAFIQPHIKDEIVSELMSYIYPLQKMSIQVYLKSLQSSMDEFNVILQVLQVMLSPYKDKQILYYSLFPQQLALYHFPQQSITNLIKLSPKSYMIQLDKKSIIYEFNIQGQKCEKIYQTQGKYQMVSCNEVEGNKNSNSGGEMLRLVLRQLSTQKVVRLLYDINNKSITQSKQLKCINDTASGQATIQMQVLITLSNQSQQHQQSISITTSSNHHNAKLSTLQQKINLRDEQILDVQIVKTLKQQKGMCQQQKDMCQMISQQQRQQNIIVSQQQKEQNINDDNQYSLIIITSSNIVVYKFKFQRINQNNSNQQSIGIKFINNDNNLNPKQTNYSYSLNGILQQQVNNNNNNNSSSYQFMSLLKYNTQMKKVGKDSSNNNNTQKNQSNNQQNNKSSLSQSKQFITNNTYRKTFAVTTVINNENNNENKINENNNENKMTVTNIHSKNHNFTQSSSYFSLRQCLNSPILYVSQSRLFILVGTSRYCDNIETNKIGKNNNFNIHKAPMILIIDLAKPSHMPQLIPLFNDQQQQQYQYHQHNLNTNTKQQSKKLIHSLDFNTNNRSLSSQESLISIVIYYSLIDASQNTSQFKQQTIHSYNASNNTIINSKTIEICFDNLKNNKVVNIRHTKPQVHVFHSLASKQCHILPINMSLPQQSNNQQSLPTYILTVQGLLLSHQNEKQQQQQSSSQNTNNKNSDSCLRIWRLGNNNDL